MVTAGSQEEENLVSMNDEPETDAPPSVDDTGDSEMPALSSEPNAITNSVEGLDEMPQPLEDVKGFIETTTHETNRADELASSGEKASKPVEREGHCYWYVCKKKIRRKHMISNSIPPPLVARIVT